MATFDLEQELDLLEWDFTPKGQPRKTGPHGTIPEPTSAQLATFTREIRHLMAPVAQMQLEGEKLDPATIDSAQLNALLEKADADEDKAQATLSAITEAVAAVCSDSPSADQIRGLPARAQQAFFGYIVGTFLDPKAQTLGSSS